MSWPLRHNGYEASQIVLGCHSHRSLGMLLQCFSRKIARAAVQSTAQQTGNVETCHRRQETPQLAHRRVPHCTVCWWSNCWPWTTSSSLRLMRRCFSSCVPSLILLVISFSYASCDYQTCLHFTWRVSVPWVASKCCGCFDGCYQDSCYSGDGNSGPIHTPLSRDMQHPNPGCNHTYPQDSMKACGLY